MSDQIVQRLQEVVDTVFMDARYKDTINEVIDLLKQAGWAALEASLDERDALRKELKEVKRDIHEQHQDFCRELEASLDERDALRKERDALLAGKFHNSIDRLKIGAEYWQRRAEASEQFINQLQEQYQEHIRLLCNDHVMFVGTLTRERDALQKERDELKARVGRVDDDLREAMDRYDSYDN